MVLVSALALAAGIAAAMPAAQFLNVPVSVRQLGMGGVGVGGGDILRGWTNPAAIADRERRGEIGLAGSSMFDGEQTTFGLGVGWMLSPRWAIGALVSSMSEGIPEVDANGLKVGSDLERGTMAAGLASAWTFGFLRAGVAAKMVSDTVMGDRVSGIAGDLGVAADWDFLAASVAYRNVGGSLKPANGQDMAAEDLPAELRGGLAFRWRPRGITVAAEAAQTTGLKTRMAAGVEWRPVAVAALRAGTSDLADAAGRISLGLSVEWKGIGVDYAWISHPVGATHTASLSFGFGALPVASVADAPSVADATGGVSADAETPRAAAEPTAPSTRGVPASAETPREPAVRSTLAVAAFDPQNVSAGDAAVIADMFRTELVKQGAFDVIEKANMDKILAEQAFQQSGCTTAECAVKLGKILNVRYLVVGSFGKLLDQYVLSIRVVETESAKVVYSDAVGELSTQREVQRAIVTVTTRLGRAFRP